MRFMMMIKGNQDSEMGKMPSEELIAAMGKYNEELAKAGVLLDLAGLKPTSAGAKIRYAAGKRSVVDGPFSEAKEVVAGYWIIQVKSREEAIAWAMRIPFEAGAAQAKPGEVAEVELRPFFELEDFAPSPAIDRARELGQELAAQKKN